MVYCLIEGDVRVSLVGRKMESGRDSEVLEVIMNLEDEEEEEKRRRKEM